MSLLPVSRRFPASALFIESNGFEYVLRPLAVTDAPGLVEAISESLTELKRFMTWAHIPQTVESQVERIGRALSPGLSGADLPLGLFTARGNRFLATAGLFPCARLNPNALEVGYWVRTSEAGRGLATLSAQALIVYAFEALEVDRIVIGHDPQNDASRRVVEKCGFVFEGILRNALARPSDDAVAAGLSPARHFPHYALIPEDRAVLSWYGPLRDRIRVADVLGEDRGFAWRVGTQGS